MVEQVSLLVAGEGAPEALVVEGLAQGTGDVVRPLGLAKGPALHLAVIGGVGWIGSTVEGGGGRVGAEAGILEVWAW